MDTLTLNIDGVFHRVKKSDIIDIKNGKALTKTKRWYEIICSHDNYEQPTNEYIVCNVCNRSIYIAELEEY